MVVIIALLNTLRIQAIVTKFPTKFTLLDIKPPTRVRMLHTEENIGAVDASVAEDRDLSIRRRSQHLGLCYYVEDFTQGSWFEGV